MNSDDPELESQLMCESIVSSHLDRKKIKFSFNEKNRVFEIPVKKNGDVVFCLNFVLHSAIEQQGMGRIMIDSYISMYQKNIFEKNNFFKNIASKFNSIFNDQLKDMPIHIKWSACDLKSSFISTDFSWLMYEYNTWSDVLGKIDRLIDCSEGIISDIDGASDFLEILGDLLLAGIRLDEFSRFRYVKQMAVCCLMYAKIFRPDLFTILADGVLESYSIHDYHDYKKNMSFLIDYIESYELMA